jgi:hypothetical protein
MERIIAGSKKYQMAIGDVKTRYSSIEEWIKERDMDIQRIPLSRGIAFFEERLYKIISLFNMNKCSIYDIFKKIIYIMGIDYADPNIRDELLNESKKTQKNTLIQYLEDDLNKRMNKINDDVVALYEIAFLYQRLIKANIK